MPLYISASLALSAQATAGVDNTQRRKWDKDEYEQKALQRHREEARIGSSRQSLRSSMLASAWLEGADVAEATGVVNLDRFPHASAGGRRAGCEAPEDCSEHGHRRAPAAQPASHHPARLLKGECPDEHVSVAESLLPAHACVIRPPRPTAACCTHPWCLTSARAGPQGENRAEADCEPRHGRGDGLLL